MTIIIERVLNSRRYGVYWRDGGERWHLHVVKDSRAEATQAARDLASRFPQSSVVS